jgi:hypothetical protein
MAKKTASVQELVEDVLRSISRPYQEDIIEEVFIRIENPPDGKAWKTQYDELYAQLGPNVTNQWIGRYTKLLTGHQTAKQVDAKRTTLTTSYSKLFP